MLHLALADVQEATGDVAAAKAVYEGLAAPLEVAEAREADKDGDASKQNSAEAAAQQVLRQVSLQIRRRRRPAQLSFRSVVLSGSCVCAWIECFNQKPRSMLCSSRGVIRTVGC